MTPAAERALAVWPLLAAQAIIFGTAAFALMLARRPECEPKRLAAALTPLWRGLALAALAFSPIVLLVDTAAMADTTAAQALPLMAEVVRETHFGRVWLYQFGAILVLIAAAWMPAGDTARTILLCAAAGVLLLLTSLGGHAIDRGPRAVVIYLIHEMAASLWIGAILGLWIGAARARLGAGWVAHTCPRVSSIAGWTVLALVASGLHTAYFALDADPDRMIYSAYGRTLTIKIAAATVVILIGGYNRFFLIPAAVKSSPRAALLRNIGIESLMLIGILGLAALLANTPPVH
jgi:putative copper resistance protein D